MIKSKHWLLKNNGWAFQEEKYISEFAAKNILNKYPKDSYIMYSTNMTVYWSKTSVYIFNQCLNQNIAKL